MSIRLLAMITGFFVCGASAHAFDEGGKVYVLRKPGPGKAVAFVKTGDSDRLRQLVDVEGYELVVRQTADGLTAVTGDLLPDELAQTEHAAAVDEAVAFGGDVAVDADFSAPARRRVSERDPVDIGLGFNLGLTTGFKVRVVGTFGPGIVAGVDLDVGTILFLNDVTASAIFGYSFEAGSHVIRPYLTIGGGSGVLFAILAASKANVAKVGAGVEWKPAKWFGLGLEGGLMAYFYADGERKGDLLGNFPFARLNIMFYFY